MIKYGKNLSVVMITMNEQMSVEKVIKDIQGIDQRIEIVIVDSSTDKTFDIAKKNGAKVIRQFPPLGYSPAMSLALKSASKEIIITIDCDDTYPCDQIDFLTKKIMEENYDVVDCDRLEKKPSSMPFINYIANFFFALIASMLFFRRMRDLHSGMRAYKKIILNKLPYDDRGVSLPVELLLWPIRLNYKVFIHTIFYRERIGKSKLEPLKAAWWTLKRILRARFKYHAKFN
jgi:glycosyltransferase involved in cell wall biosynthesis